MASTKNNDVIIYNELAQAAYFERVQDNLNVFNAASNGAILLREKGIAGDFDKTAFYKLGGEISHRDVNSDAAAEPSKIGMGEMVGVKVPFKYGPYAITEEAMKRRARSVEEFSVLVGQDYADALIAGQFAFGMAALAAAVESNAGAMKVSASLATLGKKALTQGLRKFGDKFSRVNLFVMDSATYFDLVDDAITQKIYGETEQVIYGGTPGTLGKPVLVTDKAKANTIFGLQAGALTLTNSQAPAFRAYEYNHNENLEIRVRAEGVFNVDVLGYAYKETAGANPNLATIGASGNWQKYATSDKNTAGVMIDVS